MVAVSVTLGLLAPGAAAPVPALAAAGDIAATRRYIEANYALARASVALIGPVEARIQGLNGALARECPDAGAGSPQDEASQPMSVEVAVALWSIEYGSARAPIHDFTAAVRGLRWSNPAITRRTRAYADSLSELAGIAMPDLCSDIAAWKASGFQTIPSQAQSLVRRVEAIEPKPLPAGLLAPYERGSDAGLLRRTIALEAKVADREVIYGQRDWFQLLETVGLNE